MPDDRVSALDNGTFPCLCQDPDGRLRTSGPRPAAVLSGSFNPLHHGHRELAATAVRLLGVSVAFEIPVVNVDKGRLSVAEMRRRLAQFTWYAPVWLTQAPTFLDKASLFPGCVFVVGADTAERIVQPRYYDGCATHRDEALAAIRDHGCRFLVAGRADAAGRFVGVEHLELPPGQADLFGAIARAEFDVPVSSTQLRAGRP